MLPEAAWLEPMPDARVLPEDGDPAELAASRETLRLAFVNALQHLPPRQRAVLILREVLRWQATEVAELLDTSVASVNSALQRARAKLADNELTPDTPVDPLDEDQRALLDRYVDAFERYDMDSLTSLLQEDATLSMPPFDLWLQGADEVRAWFVGHGIGCKGSRLLPVNANGRPGFAPVPAEPRAAAGSRGRSRCSRSQTGGSPISTRSSTPSGCSRCSGCRPGSTRRTSASPKRSSSSRSSREGSRSRTRHPSRRAVSWRRASASIVPAFGCVSAPTSQTSTASPERSSSERARSHRAATSAGVSGPLITSCLTLREEPPARCRRATRDLDVDARAAAERAVERDAPVERADAVGDAAQPGRAAAAVVADVDHEPAALDADVDGDEARHRRA